MSSSSKENTTINNNTKKDPLNNSSSTTTTNSQSQKIDPSTLPIEEQVNYYKNKFEQAKIIIIHDNKVKKNLEDKLSSLESKLKEYEPANGEVFKVLFKFIHETEKFYFFQSNDTTFNTTNTTNIPNTTKRSYFLNESIIDKNFKELKSQINQDQNIPEYDFEKDITQKEETINQIITQYDERLKRMHKEVEFNERKITASKELRISARNELENYKKDFDFSIQETIQNSNDVFVLLKNTLEAEADLYQDPGLQKEVFSSIKGMLNKIKDSTKSSTGNKWINELKSFICIILNKFMEIICNQVVLNNKHQNEKSQWQSTLDQVVKSHSEEILTKNKINEKIKQNIMVLNERINVLEQDKYNVAKLKDQQIEILNKEYNKRVNVNLLKSVIIQLLTTEDCKVSI